ncbi:ribose 5-phosphate isomerase A [Psittacicella melopsittaci]|uniref:Ribose-5-phosphate isomerase A n=1 Tax=Psittacicella melopsittaci TaxID=2028576 RepID=A0A3A1Y3Q8_9GAMM|nr:ribose-5-phosphate isomerase RpiA [Psittacicella melopsittaci]RIY32962.1 ribose 5-phosphate isomerase A [Psittacicella melopsittaci]
MKTQNELKEMVARQALEFVQPNQVLGVGSGSTVAIFISLLPELPFKVEYAVAASKESEANLAKVGVKVLDANTVTSLGVYIDGADEVTPEGYMTKGGGAALTREKIVASLSENFVCIVDQSKEVAKLGSQFALPVEVIPMAREVVSRALTALGGRPVYRENCITDNGNIILDVHDFVIEDPVAMEQTINNIPGVVSNGIFARNKATKVLVAK